MHAMRLETCNPAWRYATPLKIAPGRSARTFPRENPVILPWKIPWTFLEPSSWEKCSVGCLSITARGRLFYFCMLMQGRRLHFVAGWVHTVMHIWCFWCLTEGQKLQVSGCSGWVTVVSQSSRSRNWNPLCNTIAVLIAMLVHASYSVRVGLIHVLA